MWSSWSARAACVHARQRAGPGGFSAEAARVTAPLHRSDLVPDLLIALREEGVAIEEIVVSKPSLDEVFLTLPGKPAEDSTNEDQENR